MSRKATRSACPTRWSAASVPTTSPAPGSAGARSEVTSTAREPSRRAELLGRPRHSHPHHLEPRRVARRAERWPPGSAPPADERSVRLCLRDRAAAHLAARQCAAVGAGEDPYPSLAVEDTHHPALRPTEDRARRGDQALGVEPGPRVVTRAVDDLDGRPSPPLEGARGDHHRRAVGHRHRRARGDEQHRCRLTPRSFGHHVDRRPGRCPLLAVRLVVGVDDDRGREPRQRRPRGGTGPDRDRATGRRRSPCLGQERDRALRGREAGRDLLGSPTRGREHEHALDADPVEHLEYHEVWRRAPVRGGGPPAPAKQGPRPPARPNRLPAKEVVPRRAARTRARGPPGKATRSRGTRRGVPPTATRPIRRERRPEPGARVHSMPQGVSARSPQSGTTSTSTTHAPTRRPWRSIRTRLPIAMSGASDGGTR